MGSDARSDAKTVTTNTVTPHVVTRLRHGYAKFGYATSLRRLRLGYAKFGYATYGYAIGYAKHVYATMPHSYATYETPSLLA